MPIVNHWENIDQEQALKKDARYLLRGQMSNPDYMQFLTDKSRRPFVLIELTSKCNFSCYYCNSKDSVRAKGFMDEKLFYHIAAQLESVAAESVALHVDGEPTLHPKFEEFVSYLNAKSIPISLATNASLLKESFLSLQFDLCTYISASETELKERCAIDFDKYTERLVDYLRRWRESDTLQNLSLHLYHEAGLSYSSPPLLAKKRFVAELLERAGFKEVELRDNACCFFVSRKASGHRLSFSFTLIVTGGLFPGGKAPQSAPEARIPASCGFCDSAWQRMTIFWDGSIGLCCHGLQGETVYTAPGEIWEKPLAWLWHEHPHVKLFREAMANGRLVLSGCIKCLTRYPNHEFYVQGSRFVPQSDVALGVDQHIDPACKANTFAVFGFVAAAANGIVWSVGRRSQFGFRLPEAAAGEYSLEIDAIAFAPAELGEEQQLGLVVNGLKAASLKLEHGVLKTYSAHFNLGKNLEGVLVTLEFQERKSAFELGIGKDMRRLGLGIARFRVLPGRATAGQDVETVDAPVLTVF